MPQVAIPYRARQKPRITRRQRLLAEGLPPPQAAPAPPVPAPPAPAVLRTPAAARYLGVSESHLEKARIYGNGPTFVRITRAAVGYLVADLDQWLKDRRCTSTSAPSLPMPGAPAPAKAPPPSPDASRLKRPRPRGARISDARRRAAAQA